MFIISRSALAKQLVKLYQFLLFLTGALLLSSCLEKKVEPIYFGKESCHHCKMTIFDKRFGGALFTPNGKTYKFDSIECLLKYKHQHPEEMKAASIYIGDTYNDGTLIPAEQLSFTIQSEIRSPMGLGIFASQDPAQLPKGQNQKVLNWHTLLNLLQ